MDRLDLVAHLIERLNRGDAYDKSEWRDCYSRLNHPRLAEQIGPVITARSGNIVLRRTAIDIAEACLRRDLLPQLRQVAFDESDNASIRAQATHALMEILSDQERHELVPLAMNPQNDPDDEIKGWALQCTWPKHLSAPELFESLTIPQNESLIGSYAFFLYHLDFGRLSPEGAMAALQWIEGQDLKKDKYHSLRKLIPKALSEVWRNVDDDRVLERLAGFILSHEHNRSLLRYETELKTFQDEYLTAEPKRRQRLMNEVLARAPQKWSGARMLTYSPWQMVARPDLTWLVDDLLEITDEDKQKYVIELIVALVDWQHFSEIEFVWDASEKHRGLKEALRAISAISLDSDYAKWQQEDSKRSKERAKAKPERDAKTVARELLMQAEQGDLDAFWRLNLVLLENESGHVDEFTGVLTSGPIWPTLEAGEIRRVVTAAICYLNSYPLAQGYFAPNRHHRPAAAGYRALRLLFAEDLNVYSAIAAEVWAKWALPIISFSSNDSNSERKNQQRIAQECSKHAPAAFLSALSTYLSVSNDFYQVANLIEDWPDTSICDVVWSALKAAKFDKNIFERTLSQLLPNYLPALEYAKTAFEDLSPDSDELALSAATVFLRTKPRENWDRLRKIVSAQPETARKLITPFGPDWRGNRNEGGGAHLSPMQFAEMYVWIERLFTRDPEDMGAHWVTPVHEVFNFQRTCLSTLTESGMNEAVKAIAWIVEQLPNVGWLKWNLEKAKENQRRLAWVPLAPKAVLERIRRETIESQPSSDKEKLFEEDVSTKGAVQILNDVSSLPSVVPKLKPKAPCPAQPEPPLTFLVINDEWFSVHGGISTFNRHLCIALAELGHRVVCFIPEANESEIEQANKYGVTIVRAPKSPGVDVAHLFGFGPSGTISPSPNVVIGHDQVTGPVALLLARERFKCPYLHFIHSLPEALEPMKSTADGIDYLRGSRKGQGQNSISFESNVVLAVGPYLSRCMRTALLGKNNATSVVEVIPGLNHDLLTFQRPNDGEFMLDCLVSGRLDEIEIKGTGLFVRIAAAFERHPTINNVRFIMRGFSPDTMNDKVNGLKKQFGAKSLFPREFTTVEDTLLSELKSVTAFLMPSKVEGFGLTGLDAISAGIPLMASSDSGLAALLVRHAQHFSGELRRIATEAILDVGPDDEAVLSKWCDRLTKILINPKQAFLEADDLRRALAPNVSWTLAAQTVTAAARNALSAPGGQSGA